jgi:hypothetical protein
MRTRPVSLASQNGNSDMRNTFGQLWSSAGRKVEKFRSAGTETGEIWGRMSKLNLKPRRECGVGWEGEVKEVKEVKIKVGIVN